MPSAGQTATLKSRAKRAILFHYYSDPSIEQFGSTRSINAASAAAIAMHAWIRRHAFGQVLR